MVAGASLVSSRARASAASKSSPSASSLRSRSCALRRTEAGTAGAVSASRASRTGVRRGSSCANAALSLPRSRARTRSQRSNRACADARVPSSAIRAAVASASFGFFSASCPCASASRLRLRSPSGQCRGPILREQPDARARLPGGDEGAAAAPPLGRRQTLLGFGRGLPDEGRRRLRGVRRRRFENEGPRGVPNGGAIRAREPQPDPRDAHFRDLAGRCGGVGREREHLRGFPVFAALLEQARDDDRRAHAKRERPLGGEREPRLGQRLVGLAGVLERLRARQVPVGLEADGRGRDLETLRRRVEILPPRVVLREQKRDARIPGGLAGPAPHLDEGRFRLRHACRPRAGPRRGRSRRRSPPAPRACRDPRRRSSRPGRGRERRPRASPGCAGGGREPGKDQSPRTSGRPSARIRTSSS